ncbi:MAG: hypothetical protein ACRC42_01660, partial [Mycoplasma sp.]
MKKNSINFDPIKEQALNGNDLLYGWVHTIQKPTAYNFLILDIPSNIKDYITIEPSDHNIQTAPQFFDFDNINVVSINDGFEGNYFYKVKVKSTFPASLQGKLHAISVRIDPQYFDYLPGPSDPTNGYHDYTLSIPPFKFGVPYQSGPHQGKVFYTFGRAHDLILYGYFKKDVTIENIKYITDEEIGKLRDAVGDQENAREKLAIVWNNIPDANIPFTNSMTSTSRLLEVYFNSTEFREFPKENVGAPDTTKIQIIAYLTAPQIEYSLQQILFNTYWRYFDERNKYLEAEIDNPTYRTANAEGAWLRLSYAYQVVIENEKYEGEGESDDEYVIEFIPALDQSIYPTDYAIIQVNVTAKNTGSKQSYNTGIEIHYPKNVNFMRQIFRPNYTYRLNEKGATINILTLKTGRTIAPNELFTEVLYFKLSPIQARRLLSDETGRIIVNKVEAAIDLTSKEGEVPVTQVIDTPFMVYYPEGGREERENTVIMTLANSGTYAVPIITINATPKPDKTPSGN